MILKINNYQRYGCVKLSTFVGMQDVTELRPISDWLPTTLKEVKKRGRKKKVEEN